MWETKVCADEDVEWKEFEVSWAVINKYVSAGSTLKRKCNVFPCCASDGIMMMPINTSLNLSWQAPPDVSNHGKWIITKGLNCVFNDPNFVGLSKCAAAVCVLFLVLPSNFPLEKRRLCCWAGLSLAEDSIRKESWTHGCYSIRKQSNCY